MQKLSALVSVLFVWHSLMAQPSNASFLHYTIDEGLSNDHVTAIARDRPGFLWVGTVKGLNRFDGRVFKTFRHDPGDGNSIPGDYIMGIAAAPDGSLWVSTTKGLCKLDPGGLDIQRIWLPENADTLENDIVGGVAFDSKGMAWTTTETGIYKIDPRTGKPLFFFKTKEGVLGWYGIIMDGQDRLWMSKRGVYRFDPRTLEMKLFNGAGPKDSLAEKYIMSLAPDASGGFWASTWYNGIWKYARDIDEFVRHSPEPPFSYASALFPDSLSSGRLFFWVGSGKSGLGIYYPDTGQFIEFRSDKQDPYTHNNDIAKVLFKDPSGGDVWIGTESGLEHYAPATIRFGRAIIPPEKDMGRFNRVSGVVQDNADPSGQRYFVAVWGTGLFAWDKISGAFTYLKPGKPGPADAAIAGMFQDGRGYVWVCMKDGMGRYHPQTGEWRYYKNMFRQKVLRNTFWCGLEDRKGNLWFGSNRDGLFRYNLKTDRVEQAFYKKEFTDAKGDLNVVAMSEDRQGRLWLACYDNSLVCYDPATGAARRFSYTGRNISPVCTAVRVAANGRIYAAFIEAFVELDADGKLSRYFTMENGLKADRVNRIVEDRQGKIWFNTKFLLHRFDPVSGAFHYYGKRDGLFSNIATDALSITPAGEIFVGFHNAFNFFFPERLQRNLQPPPIAVTSIKVMNKERKLSVGGRTSFSLASLFSAAGDLETDTFLALHPGDNFFEIEFAALNFNQQERNRYAYRLEGFNKSWVYTERPVAIFTNLDGGRYLLRMKAANNDGVWNEQGATLAIRVRPPFYDTWWFPFLVALGIAGVAAGLFWLRLQQRRRLEKFRQSLARDLHDEMGSTLSSIRFFSDFIHRQIGADKPQITPMLQRISQSASNLSESMQDIIWAMKTKNDQLEDLATRMTEFGLHLFESRNVQFKTYISEDLPEKHLQPEVRRNIYLIFKEAANNAAKYAEASVVELHFTLKKGLLFMMISDNGRGFEPGGPLKGSGGNGLYNMQQRAADIGGRLEVFSRPGGGATVELQIKV